MPKQNRRPLKSEYSIKVKPLSKVRKWDRNKLSNSVGEQNEGKEEAEPYILYEKDQAEGIFTEK